MKINAAIAVARELQEYRDSDCKHKATAHSPERWIKQFAVKRSTGAEFKIGERVMDIAARRSSRTVWVRLDRIVSPQRCLSLRRLVFQLRRHPIKRKPSGVALPGGRFLLWDGNHRVAAAMLRGARWVKCKQYSRK